MIKLTSLLQEDQQTEDQAKQNVINRLSDQSVRKALDILYHYERTGKLPPQITWQQLDKILPTMADRILRPVQ